MRYDQDNSTLAVTQIQNQIQVNNSIDESDDLDSITGAIPSHSVNIPRIDLANIPIEIEFNLGVVRMTKESLSNLEVDDIVEIGKDGNSIVSVVVNNRQIARGNIVSVNQQLAIQITSIGL